LGNALKLTKQGHVLLKVTHAGPGRARVAITDTGIGIPAQAQTQLFGKFTQADSTTTRKFGGTGLGLAICKQLVELMGGTIGLESSPGQGSTFWFTYPLPVSNAHSSAPPLNPIPPGTRVLVVDALPCSTEVWREQLLHWEVECETAASAEDALATLRQAAQAQRPFKLVLIDSTAAGSDLCDLGKAIRTDPCLCKSRLILMAPSIRRGDGTKFMAAGYASVLWKPFVRHTQLVEAINAFISTEPGGYETTFFTAPAPARTAPRRVLVADGTKMNQTLAGRILTKAGCIVDIADTGIGAAELAARNDYDLIFLDCHLPDDSGFLAAETIRAHPSTPRRTPIIALSEDVDATHKCRQVGMDDLILKPVKSGEIEKVIARWAA
jgi:CheY-like chemotaxis protein